MYRYIQVTILLSLGDTNGVMDNELRSDVSVALRQKERVRDLILPKTLILVVLFF